MSELTNKFAYDSLLTLEKSLLAAKAELSHLKASLAKREAEIVVLKQAQERWIAYGKP